MPFKSKSQQGFMFSNHPRMAKQWASETPNMSALPNYASDDDKKKKKKGFPSLSQYLNKSSGGSGSEGQY